MSSFNPQEERQLARDFVLHYLKDDGVFVTRLLSLNSSDLVVTEIINQLWTRYKAAYRIYSTGQPSSRSNPPHPPPNELNTSTQSSTINHQNGMTNTSEYYRQRTSRIPAPPLPPPPSLPTFFHRSKSQQLKSEVINDNTKSAKDTDV